MVKLGFIVEGDSEKIVIESPAFVSLCELAGLELCHPVINAKGGGNLLPENVSHFVATLKHAGAERIVVLTDLEEAETIDEVKARISVEGVDEIIIAVKALEAWFLADSSAMTKWLGVPHEEPHPEKTEGMPWTRLKAIAQHYNTRGPGASKKLFARKMTAKYGFSVEVASNHPECPSVKYFFDQLHAVENG